MKCNHLTSALLAISCAAALAGCGNLTKSPADGLTFKAPDDFTSKLAALGLMQVWTKGSGNATQGLMLFRSPVEGKSWSVDDALKNAKVSGDVVARRKITICGNQTALFAHVQGTFNETSGNTTTARKENIEVVVLQSTKPIMAMYSYPTNALPDANAETALRELCPST